jgi:hypothetical protein
VSRILRPYQTQLNDDKIFFFRFELCCNRFYSLYRRNTPVRLPSGLVAVERKGIVVRCLGKRREIDKDPS